MTYTIPYPDTGDAGAGPGRGSPTAYPGTPRWVKVSGIIALALVLLVAILLVAGGGRHGPARHIPSGSGSSYAPAIAIGAEEP